MGMLTQGPSAAYIADKSAKYPGQGVPGNPRPSEYHWWMPGFGWQFIAEYDQGNNLQQQYAALNPVALDAALSQGYEHQMSAAAQAVADAQGITVTTGPQYGYQAQYPENGATAPAPATTATTTPATPATPATPQYTLADINALYQKHLNRDGNPVNMQHWLDDINVRGQTIEQVEANIMRSEEYLTNQANAAATPTTTTPTTTTPTTGTTEPTLTGYYWGLGANNGWQWLAYYSNEGPPSGAITWGTDTDLPDVPPGWVNPNATTAPVEPVDPPVVEEPKLFTPDGSQFYQGMFTANDMLFRDGKTVDSGFYNGLRQNILASLAQTAADNGRTQNTAEEIAIAQGNYNGYSANGMLSPSVSNTARSLGLY
jgi:hypothetical protein